MGTRAPGQAVEAVPVASVWQKILRYLAAGSSRSPLETEEPRPPQMGRVEGLVLSSGPASSRLMPRVELMVARVGLAISDRGELTDQPLARDVPPSLRRKPATVVTQTPTLGQVVVMGSVLHQIHRLGSSLAAHRY